MESIKLQSTRSASRRSAYPSAHTPNTSISGSVALDERDSRPLRDTDLDDEADVDAFTALLPSEESATPPAPRKRWTLSGRHLLIVLGVFIVMVSLVMGASWVQPKPCPLSCMEARVSTTWRQHEMLLILAHSWLAAMPCFPPFHLIVPTRETDLFEAWVAEHKLPNFFVHPDNLPNITKPWARPQYSDFVADSIGTSPYIMSLDTDVIFAAPITCNSFFDADGKPYRTYYDQWWQTYEDNQVLLRNAKQNQPDKWAYTLEDVEKLANVNFMGFLLRIRLRLCFTTHLSHSPIIYTRDLVRLMREIVLDAHGTNDLDVGLARSGIFSQFDLLGKIAFMLHHDQYHWIPLPMPEMAFTLEPDRYRESQDFTMSAAHVSWPHFLVHPGYHGLKDYPDPDWAAYAEPFARHLICTRQDLGPSNSYFSHDLFGTTLLKDWDHDCSAGADLKLPYKGIAAYSEDFVPYSGQRWRERYLRGRREKRQWCYLSN